MPTPKTFAMAALIVMAPAAAFAQGPASPAAGGAGGALTVEGFADAATRNSLSEVLMSTMALQKSEDMRVNEHAWTMLDHHGRALGDLADALEAGSAALPSEPSPEQEAALERMRALEGTAFDEAYFEHQFEAHRSAIDLFENAASLPDETVARYAAVTVPILRAHGEIAQERQDRAPIPMPGR